MALGGPPAAAFYFGFRALYAAIQDLPEYFYMRVEPGLDEATRASLHAAIQVVLRIRRLAWIAFVVGLVVLTVGLLLDSFLRIPLLPWIGAAGLTAWAVALTILVYAGIVGLANRQDLRRLDPFVRAMRGSSLARDLA